MFSSKCPGLSSLCPLTPFLVHSPHKSLSNKFGFSLPFEVHRESLGHEALVGSIQEDSLIIITLGEAQGRGEVVVNECRYRSSAGAGGLAQKDYRGKEEKG